jgi:hypothetical protein
MEVRNDHQYEGGGTTTFDDKRPSLPSIGNSRAVLPSPSIPKGTFGNSSRSMSVSQANVDGRKAMREGIEMLEVKLL